MKIRRKTAGIMAVVSLACAVLGPVNVQADSKADLNKPYIALGADLNQQERATVLELLDVTEDELKDNISGTAALVGAMEAYENMTGDVIQPDNVEAATNELVVTSELGEVIGDQEKAEELIGAVKDIIVAEEIQDPELIEEKVSETADKLEVSLSEEDKQQIVELMQKIADLDLDIDSLKQQAKELYDKLGSLGVDLNISKSDVDGFFAKMGTSAKELWDSIRDFFTGLFN